MILHPFVRALKASTAAIVPDLASGRIVVACSGGADSLALLHALWTLQQRDPAWKSAHIHVAHLDHGLRSVDSQADATFVGEMATALGLPCTIGTLSAADRATWSGSLEASAREARYAFLQQVRQQTDSMAIALGHTLDDQAETVLMHVLRGSGLAGLRGMEPWRSYLFRPLLDQRRAATVGYCRAMGLAWREDETNSSPRFLRNRIRHELLPQLATYQADVSAVLARMAVLLGHDATYIDTQADAAWTRLVHINENHCRIARRELREQPTALRWRLLHRLAIWAVPPEIQITQTTVQRLDRVVMDNEVAPRQIEIGGGCQITILARIVRADCSGRTRKLPDLERDL